MVVETEGNDTNDTRTLLLFESYDKRLHCKMSRLKEDLPSQEAFGVWITNHFQWQVQIITGAQKGNINRPTDNHWSRLILKAAVNSLPDTSLTSNL